ncbi:heavy metal translocating P-type ATPase [soil metagenome]
MPDVSAGLPARILGAAKNYPVVAATALVGLVGLVLWMVGLAEVDRWLFSAFALVVAGLEAVEMLKQLRRGVFGIDVLAIIAIVSTVLVGEYVASLIIALMISGGKALEDYAQGRAKRELDALLRREPQEAHLLLDEGAVRDIPAAEVRVGDRILVRPAEVVPVDGRLVSVSAAFDQSSLTGESLPVQRGAGELVLSGAINGQTAATVEATALAVDSQFQGIIALVKQASESRAPVVRLADRYAIPFPAVSLLIGIAAWVVSGDPVRFAQVIVLATPCPLLLAAPVAFMGGMSRAARQGIVVKGGGVLETLARVRTAVFDKTGTLTHGSPTIVRIVPAPPFSEDDLLALVASVETFSSHVLAASVVQAAEQRGLALIGVDDAVELAAQGITGRAGERRVAVGTLAFVSGQCPDATAAVIEGGELAIYSAVDGRFAGTIIASDPVRPNAKATLAQLDALGIHELVMLTGDALPTARHVAQTVGITTLRAECLPADKVNEVATLPLRPVMMVGDGVNDAPVLAAADVGIAMGARGATAASESADAVILLDDISAVARVVRIGKDTVQIALQSIWLGIALSLGLMVVAFFGVIPATVGAAVQEVVDLATILNALRAIRPGEHSVGADSPAGER